MQNIPVRDNPVFREPWIARPYHKLLIADYSSQEPRITAQLTGDEHLIEIFRSGKDPYIEIAKRVHRLEITKDDPIRQDIKTDILAAIYGQRPHDKESEERLWRFNEYFYRIRQWCDAQQANKQYAESVMGRRLWVNPYSSQYYTNNLNHPHQSTAADMMKMAIVKMHQGWKFNCPFGVVIPVHDEVILDVPEKYAEEIAEFVEDCMVSVAENMCPTVPFVAEVHICDSWSEK
jgi:DNA polymerase-1